MSESQQHSQDRMTAFEQKLSDLACQFRGNPNQQVQIAKEYAATMEELFRFPSWHGDPDLDSLLPEEYMPDSYVRHWDKKLGIARIVIHEISRVNGISCSCSESEFKHQLATVIHHIQTQMGIPVNDGRDLLEKMGGAIAALAIFLQLKLMGPNLPELIWRVCKRCLGITNIIVSPEGHDEFVNKLLIPGVAAEDIEIALVRSATIAESDAISRARNASFVNNRSD